MSNTKWKAMSLLLAISLFFAGTTAAGAVPGPEGAALKTVLKDGQVYVAAADLEAATGLSGTYDATTRTYTLNGEVSAADIIEQTSPSVVAIIGKPSTSEIADDRFNLAHGTGVIVKQDGWIITNAHVVKEMSDITVITSDGKEYSAKNTHMDEASDLALVKVEAEGLPEARFSTGPVRVGDPVIAIGTPIDFALRNSASMGIISGMNRSVQSDYRLLQTDAAINPGNSGGPLINMKGEVVGINSLKFSGYGVDNLGFSIPADTVLYVLEHFLEYDKVLRPETGLKLEESWSAVVGLPSLDPLKVTSVAEGSPADQAGIRQGDVLYAIEEHNIYTMVDYNEAMKGYLPGDQITLVMLSDGDLVQREVTLK